MMEVNEMWVLKKDANGKYSKDQPIKLPPASEVYGTMPSRSNVENVFEKIPGLN
jgi:hypothetical protein